MSMSSTMQVGRVTSNEPQAQFSTGFLSELLRIGSRVQALRSSPAQPRLAASAEGRRHSVSAGQDSDSMMKRLYDAWLL